jgi:uncharacterized protein
MAGLAVTGDDGVARTGNGPAGRAGVSRAGPAGQVEQTRTVPATGAPHVAGLVDPAHRLVRRPLVSGYWPWWAGALGLALVTINYTLVTDRSFGVSAAWDRVLHWRAERRLERQEAEFADDRVLAEALLAATAQEFGTLSGAPGPVDTVDGEPLMLVDEAEPATGAGAEPANLRAAPVVTQAALLLAIFFGGWLAAVTSGRFRIRLDMGPGFRDLVTANPTAMVVVLFVGGVLVGFGTRLAGGCSSGHGLSGCGRLRPVSLVATAVFFGAAVVVSFLLWKVI